MNWIIAAHQDDETISMFSVLKEKGPKKIIFLTKGSISNSKSNLILIRKNEALLAAKKVGIKPKDVHFLEYCDQELYLNISKAIRDLIKLSKKVKPKIIHVSCYEGNHPDHDASRFIAWTVAKLLNVQLLEYSTNLIRKDLKPSVMKRSKFIIKQLSDEEFALKKNIIKNIYVSQGINPDERYNSYEYFRQAENNDYESVYEHNLFYESISLIKVKKLDVLKSFRNAS